MLVVEALLNFGRFLKYKNTPLFSPKLLTYHHTLTVLRELCIYATNTLCVIKNSKRRAMHEITSVLRKHKGPVDEKFATQKFSNIVKKKLNHHEMLLNLKPDGI